MNLLKKALKFMVFTAATLGVVGASVYYGSKSIKPVIEPFRAQISNVFHSIEAKGEQLKQADRENDLLRRQNLALKKEIQVLKYKGTVKQFKSHTTAAGQALKDRTGSPVGRVLASIQYRPPVELNPAQLLVMGASYLKANEDEKAAVIFSQVTDLDEHSDNPFNTARNLMTAGMIWYRLDHLHLAEQYLERSLKSELGDTPAKYHAQARLWLALLSRRAKKPPQSQAWLRDLLDHHPHSMEAQWVNRPESLSVMSEEGSP